VIPASSSAAVPAAAIDDLFAQSESGRWGVSRDRFAEAVCRAAEKIAPGGGAAASAAVASLHARDLALAVACADGYDAAWEHFVLTYRPELYRAARAMTDESTGRELADSLYADLFGLGGREGRGQSLFRYYHGRAKLSTWLRSVLAQRHVDVVRARKRLTTIDDPDHPVETRLPAQAPADAARAQAMRVAAGAVAGALAALEGADRVRLAYYYVHGLTLAQAGRLFGESEATASRKLERIRRQLQTAIGAALGPHGMAPDDVADWADVARTAWDGALAEALGVPAPQETGPPSFKGKRTP
jgi:RNA polymerase sigma-70 factor, ECF subfamily